MPFPFGIQIGSTSILLHPVIETLGIFVGFRYFLYLKKKQPDPIENSNRVWVVIGAIFGSIVGSRLIGGLEDINALTQTENLFRHFFQNKTVVGGFLGGLMGVELIKVIIGEKKASGDLFVYPLLLALIIGRLGCFSMGVYEETYGNPSALPWAMDLGDGILRHPVTFYEIIFLLTLWLVLRQISVKLPLANGALFKLFMIAYLLFRFLLDFIKPHYTFNMGLSTIQLTCILGLLWYLKYLLRPEKLLATDSK